MSLLRLPRNAAKNIASDLIWPCVTRSRDEGRLTYCSSQFCFVLFRRGSRLWLSNEPFWNEASVTCVCGALRAIGGLRTICLSLGWVMCVCLCVSVVAAWPWLKSSITAALGPVDWCRVVREGPWMKGKRVHLRERYRERCTCMNSYKACLCVCVCARACVRACVRVNVSGLQRYSPSFV